MTGQFTLDYGQQPSAHQPGPGRQSARVAGIGPDQLQPGEIAQQLGQRQFGAVPILVSRHGAGSRCRRQEPPPPATIPWYPLRYAFGVRLPSGRHRSLWALFFRGLRRLAAIFGKSADGRAGRGVTPHCYPDPLPKGCHDPFPSAIIPPLPKVPPDRAPGWQVVGQHPPGNAAAPHVQNGIDASRRSVVLGWPLVVCGGSRGSNSAHWASVKSVG